MFQNINHLFWERLNVIYPQKDQEIIKTWYTVEKRKTTFRINTLKSNTQEILESLHKVWLKAITFPPIDNCFILENGTESDLWKLDIYTQGKIYLQQIASQIPVHFLNLNPEMKVLDATAAPGSKTSQIAARLSNTWEIIANELHQMRIGKLNFTLQRQWVTNTKVLKWDARKMKKNLLDTYNIKAWEYFDAILLDAPCSAEGRINLNNERSYWFWKEDIFKKHYKISKQIIDEIIPLLKSGWELVFSTCTLAPEENEAIVHYILCNYDNLELVPITLDFEYIRPGITHFWKYVYKNEVKDTLRCLPSEITEGFYIAKFKKKK